MKKYLFLVIILFLFNNIYSINNDIDEKTKVFFNTYFGIHYNYPEVKDWDYKIYESELGNRVYISGDNEKVIYIGWYNNIDEKSKKIIDDIEVETKGEYLGFYVETKNNKTHKFYCHLNPDTMIAKAILKLYQSSVDAKIIDGFELPQGTAIGEVGTSGHSKSPNLLFITYVLK